MAEIPQDASITRGDGFAGGIIKQGKMYVWERWEIREIKEHVIGLYLDESFISPDEDRLVSMLLTPTYINLN